MRLARVVPIVSALALAPALGSGQNSPDDQARRLLEDAGANVLYREYPLPHAIDPRFLAEVREWLVPALR
jgi:hypothetical protein